MMLPRGPWVEFETDDPDEHVLIHPGWTNDTEPLIVAVREAGWFATSSAAFAAAEDIVLSWGWVGTDENGELRRCDYLGVPEGGDVEDGLLHDVDTVTFARLGNGESLGQRGSGRPH